MRITSRHVDAEGFFHGTQGTTTEPMLAQIGAQSEKAGAVLRARRVPALKRLEAKVQGTADRVRALEIRKSEVAEKIGEERPHLLRALGAVTLAALAVVGEVILLAPVMDGFGIADRGLQELAAFVLVLVSSGLVHLLSARMTVGVHGRAPVPRPWTSVLVTAAFGALTFGLLVVLGWWRGSEMLFAAEATGGEWAAFMASAATLTCLCVTLLTVALPIFAAVIGEAAFRELFLAWAVLRTDYALARAAARLHRLTKRLEAKEVKLAETLEALTKEEERLRHVYLEHHELGRRLGATQEPSARLVLRCGAVALLVLLACALADPFLARFIADETTRGFLTILAVTGIGGLYCAHAWRSWERPTPARLFRARAVHWREDPAITPPPSRTERPFVPVVLGRSARTDLQ